MQEIFPERAFTHKLPLQATDGFPVCMIITPPLPAKPVDKVIFIIKSHDQGWCSQDNFPGVYPGSWTWFEAMILRPVGGGDDWISLYWAKRGISSEPSVASALAKLAGLDKPPPKEQAILCFVPNPKRPPSHSWHVQKNRRGNSKPKEYMVVWDKTGKQSRMERLGCEFDTDTGASSGIGFVNSLQEGDRIVLIAYAKVRRIPVYTSTPQRLKYAFYCA